MRGLVLAAVLAALVGVLAGGCGGGETLSTEEYSSQLNAICADFNAKEEEIGEPTSISEFAEKGPQLLVAFDAMIAELEKLKAPSEVKADADGFASGVKELRDLVSDAIDAVQQNDTATINAFQAKVEPLVATFLTLGQELGAPACAGEQAQPAGTSGPATSAPTVTTAPVTTTAAPPSGIPLVIDTDLAVDSIMALLYLLGRPEVDIAAITVSGTGEVRCGPGAEIAAGVVALAGAGGIPVACGPGEPLAGFNAFPADWRSAADEAWGLDLPAGEAPSELPAPDLLVSVVSSSDEPLVVFTDGPLTNLAAALRLDPAIAGRIAMVYVMGGAVDVPGNTPVNPDAEYNIWVDPTAAAEVLASGAPVTLVPLDTTNQVPLEARHVQALEAHSAAPAAAAALTMLQPGVNVGLFFWDQLAAAILVDESLAGFETMTLAVTTGSGPETVGVTRRAPDGDEIRVAVTVDAARFEREFLSSLASEDVGPIVRRR